MTEPHCFVTDDSKNLSRPVAEARPDSVFAARVLGAGPVVSFPRKTIHSHIQESHKMRSSSPFVWLTLVLAVCLGLAFAPAANAQFTITEGPSFTCLEDPASANDTIDAPTDSVQITVTMVGDEDFSESLQIIFNPQPGLGVLPVLPTK